MEIIIHRYLLEGKNKIAENTLSQLKRAVKAGKFFETDIRRLKDGQFYISHDLQTEITAENDAASHAEIWQKENCRIALNIKELGYEQELVEFLKQHNVLKNVFLFDFDIEFLGAEPQNYINRISQLASSLECAVRVSDHNEPVERALAIKNSNIIWLDEFDSLWVVQKDINRLKEAGKTVYCISPDLHNFTLEQSEKRWADFIAWKVDGICTDYPLLLEQILAK